MKKEIKKRVMKAILRDFPVGLALVAILAFTHKTLTSTDPLEIGENAPETEVKMQDVSGEMYSLQDLKQENGLLVIFSCNTCPFVVGKWGEDNDGNMIKTSDGWEGRYNTVYDFAKENKVGVVLVNSNEAQRDDEDSYKSMQNRAKGRRYKSPYVLDKNNVLADAFGAKTTPHVFLFDKDMKLVYKGAIDDNVSTAKKVEQTWLRNAIGKLAKGEKIDPAETRNMGCNIKRVKL